MKEHPTRCRLGLTRETLSAWRDQELPDADAQRIALHVPDCATCQRRLGQFTHIATVLQRQSTTDLRAQIWSGIQARLVQKERFPMRSRISAFNSLSIAAVVVLLSVLFAVVLSHRPSPTTGPLSGTITPTIMPIGTTQTIQPTGTPSLIAQTPTVMPLPSTTPPPVTPTLSATACQFNHSEPPPANVPLPPGTITGGGNGAGGEVVTQVCTPGATQESINTFMAAHLPGVGWHPYNSSTDVNGGCSDTFWTWASGHTALYWSFGNGYLGQGLPYWTIWTCGRINMG